MIDRRWLESWIRRHNSMIMSSRRMAAGSLHARHDSQVQFKRAMAEGRRVVSAWPWVGAAISALMQ